MPQPIPFEIDLAARPEVIAFFDPGSNTFSYVVTDPSSKACAVVDSVWNFDYAAGRLSTAGADQIINHIRDAGLELQWLIETHIHADHLSAALYIQQQLGGQLGIGEQIAGLQQEFGRVFDAGTEFARDGSQFDRLFADGDGYQLGNLQCHALHTPGHTPACMSHVMGDAVFVGDTLFMPDSGTARADFPGGNARTLYQSIQRVLSLPDASRLFMCHDYMPNDRALAFETTVAEQKAANIHVHQGVSEDEFARLREARDSTLGMPTLIMPALQVNMRAGQLPPEDSNGITYLKVPINVL